VPPLAAYGQNGQEKPYDFRKKEGIEWIYVPYTSDDGPGLNRPLGGHVEVFQQAGIRTHVKSGKLRLLSVHMHNRMKQFPDVPTLEELGMVLR